MKRIVSVDGLFHEGNSAIGQKGTKVTADWLNALQDEVVGVIEFAGMELDPANNNQLIAAIRSGRFQGVVYADVHDTLAEADAIAAAADSLLVISTVWAVPVADTLTAATMVLPGGGFDIAGALNVSGPFFSPGCYRVFWGAGSVSFSGPVKEVTPQMWGAVGDGVADDAPALQAFFTCLQSSKVPALMRGDFRTSTALTFTGGAGASVAFDCTITAIAALDWVLKFVGHSGVYFPGRLTVYGAGTNAYSGRTCKDGIVFENCRGSRFEKPRAEKFLRNGIYVTAVGNNTLLNLGDARAYYCGSSITPDYAVSGAYSGKVNSGVASSSSQRSTITLPAVPANLAVNMLAEIGGEPYLVTAIAGNDVSVYPWIKNAAASGTVNFYIGAGLKIEGDDAASVNFDSVDSTYCAVAVHSASLYGFKGSRLVTQFNGAGLVVGNNGTSGYYGNTLDSFYTEGNTFDLIKTTNGSVGLTINGMYVLSADKFYQLAPRLATLEYDGNYITLNSVLINTGGKRLARLQATNGLGGYLTNYTVTADNSIIPIKAGYDVNIALAVDVGEHRNFGYNHVGFIIYGRRTGSRVDSITFTPSNVAHTVMGGANYTISGVTSIMQVMAWFDYEANNWVISKSEMSTRLSGSAVYDPASLADGAGATTTVAVPGAVMGDFAVASFSNNLAGITLTAWVSAADTVSVRFQNESGGVLDLASGTLRALVIRQ